MSEYVKRWEQRLAKISAIRKRMNPLCIGISVTGISDEIARLKQLSSELAQAETDMKAIPE